MPHEQAAPAPDAAAPAADAPKAADAPADAPKPKKKKVRILCNWACWREPHVKLGEHLQLTRLLAGRPRARRCCPRARGGEEGGRAQGC